MGNFFLSLCLGLVSCFFRFLIKDFHKYLNFHLESYGVMAQVLNCILEVSKFKLQLHYYICFWEEYEPPYLPSYELNIITAVSTKMVLALNNP